jgi:hypothetical protein
LTRRDGLRGLTFVGPRLLVLGIAFSCVGGPAKAPRKIFCSRCRDSLSSARGIAMYRPKKELHPDRPRVEHVGQCIYCTEVVQQGLTREHVLPRALWGGLILLEAVCDRHRDLINQQIETPILDKALGPFRRAAGLRSSIKKPRHVIYAVERHDGTRASWLVPEMDTPSALVLPRLTNVPGILGGKTLDGSKPSFFLAVAKPSRFKDIRGRAKESGFRSVRLQAYIPVPIFLRFLAKIAHGYTVAYHKFDFEPALLGIIEGTKLGAVDRFIGASSLPFERQTMPSHLLEIRYHPGELGILIRVDIQLFSHWGTPTYTVISGKLRPGVPMLESR